MMRKKIRILIVDDDRRMVRTLMDILKIKGYSADGANSGPQALKKLSSNHFECALVDIKMPQMNGVELYRAIKTKQPDLPVVLMTAYSVDKLVKEGMKEGVVATLTKPLDINLLLSFLSSLRKERSIVIVDDDPNFSKTLGDILQARGFKVTQVSDPYAAVKSLRPDGQVVLLDMKLNERSGWDVLKEIREHSLGLPVVLVTGYREEMASTIRVALKLKAYTCLYKPFMIDKLLQILREIRCKELRKILS